MTAVVGDAPELLLRVLGSISLSRPDGTPVQSILAQPKRVALLAYLASSHPPAPHPRDELLALLWPDLDQQRARRALRQALHGLRKSLGPDVVTGKGRELVGVDPERLRCDAVEFYRALDDGRTREALEMYRGDFLRGFHVSGALEFERWTEQRRRELRLEAVGAAWQVAESLEADGKAGEARRAGEKALELAPLDGEAVRRYVLLMDRLGQPAAAIRAYRTYEERLREELDLDPSPETRALAESVREGGDPPERSSSVSAAGDEVQPARAPRPAASTDGGNEPGGSSSNVGPDDRGAPEESAASASPLGRWAAVAVVTIILFSALVYAGLGWPGSPRSPVAERPIRSVAVLPFDDLSPAGDQRWFGHGIAEEILDVLVRMEPLQVMGRSSSFQFEGTSPDVRLVGDSLGVGAVLEGSVRRAGDRVRVTVQLVRTSDGAHLWSETYERGFTYEAIFDIQEEVARSVAGALEVELGLTASAPRPAERPVNLEAYTLYLQARHAVRQRTGEGRARALTLIRDALEEDPGFAPAWALAAQWHVQVQFWEPFDGTVDVEASRARALEAAEQAVELAPDLAQAHATMGFVLSNRHRWTEAWSHHARSLELNPRSPEARATTLWHLASLGEWDRALEHARVRQRLDPLYVPANGNLGGMLMYAGRFEEAATQWRHTIELSGDQDAQARFVRSVAAKLFALQGRPERAVAASREAYEYPGESYQPRKSYYLSHLGAMHALAGEQGAAEALLDSLRADPDPELRAPLRWLRAFDVARVHAALARPDSAFTWLERSRPDRWRPLEVARFRGDPWWAPIRDDPRYGALLEALGLG